MDKHFFETNCTEDILKDRIRSIDIERDSREQEYYRKKIALSTEYETTSAILLNEKTYLKCWLRALDFQNPTESLD